MKGNIMQTIDITSLDGETRARLAGELKNAARARDAVLIRGAAGAWRHELGADETAADFHPLALSLMTHPAPVALSLDGPVTGFGAALVVAADVVVASDDVTLSMGSAATALATGAFRLLTTSVSPAFAQGLAHTGRTLTRAEAITAGLVVDIDVQVIDTAGATAIKRASVADRIAGLTEALAYDALLVRTVSS
jgi:enoyl-CoA hydratase/carnithine racemase